MLDWQEVLTIGVALACGIWVLRQFMLPFFPGETGECSGCVGAGCGGEAPPAAGGELLQILPGEGEG